MLLKLKTESVAYDSQGSHRGQLNFNNCLVDGRTTDNAISIRSVKYNNVDFLNQLYYFSFKQLPNFTHEAR